jgi:hypothetical protein
MPLPLLPMPDLPLPYCESAGESSWPLQGLLAVRSTCLRVAVAVRVWRCQIPVSLLYAALCLLRLRHEQPRAPAKPVNMNGVSQSR